MISCGTSEDADNHLRSLGLSGILIGPIRNRRSMARQVVSASGWLVCRKGPKEEPASVTGGKREKTTPHALDPSDKNPIEAKRLQIRWSLDQARGG
jgi:hypothetical protein